jgi:predicted RNA-binding Zn-ribbon protein involved in translation (DUF1610 family)
MNILDGQRHVAEEETCKLPWMGEKNGKLFKCGMCGHKFQPGEGFRFQMMKKHGNILVCDECDTSDIKRDWEEMGIRWEQIQKKYWIFIGNENARAIQEEANRK